VESDNQIGSSRGSHSDLDWSGTLTAYLFLAGHKIASPNVLIMVQLERSSFNSLSSKGSVSTGAQDIAALDADCPKIVNYFGGFTTRKPTPTRTSVSRGNRWSVSTIKT